MQKLVTTAAALDRLGPEARFETAVVASGPITEGVLDGDLYLRGSGDPSFGTAALRRLAKKVGETDLEDVGGRIYGDESSSTAAAAAPASESRPMSGRCPRWPSTADRCCRLLGDGRAILPRSWPAGCA